jgi:uncharacterized damage-inducible protein DinB
MSTGAPAYFGRIMEDDGLPVEELVAWYRRGSAELARAVAGLDAGQLVARPVAGRMSTLEVLGHVCDCEQFLADRMKRTIATDMPLLVGVNGDGYLEALHYHERDVDTQLRLVEITRAQMADDLTRLSDQAWARTAIHTEVGMLTLRQILLHTVRHLDRHVAAIQEKRDALGL